MFKEIVDTLSSFIQYANLIGIGLAVLFGIIWLVCYFPPFAKKRWLWLALLAGALGTLFVVVFIQTPFRSLIQGALLSLFGGNLLVQLIVSTNIITVFFSAFFQEGAKLLPAVFYWWHNDRKISPRMGLLVGAVAGLGWGVLEAARTLNFALAQGMNLETAAIVGIAALAPFWEKFFTVAFQASATALAGYGLAKGWGWQFFLMAFAMHAVLGQGPLLLYSGTLALEEVEIGIALLSVAVTAVALWLRYRKEELVVTKSVAEVITLSSEPAVTPNGKEESEQA